MTFSFWRWRRRHLVLAYVVYWVTLAAVMLHTPIRTGWRLTRLPDGHASISADFGNAVFHVTMTEDGRTVWAGSAHLATVALWLAGPPVILWLLWLRQRRKSRVEPRPVRV